jgi:hypothetical protein
MKYESYEKKYVKLIRLSFRLNMASNSPPPLPGASPILEEALRYRIQASICGGQYPEVEVTKESIG